MERNTGLSVLRPPCIDRLWQFDMFDHFFGIPKGISAAITKFHSSQLLVLGVDEEVQT